MIIHVFLLLLQPRDPLRARWGSAEKGGEADQFIEVEASVAAVVDSTNG